MTGKRRAGRSGRPPFQPPTQPPEPSQPPEQSPSTFGASPFGGTSGRADVVPPPTRREVRARRRRQRRRRLGAGGVGAVIVVVLALLAGGGFFVHRATSGSEQPVDPQQTMLISLQAADRSAVATMLAAHQATPRQGFEMLVPSRLLTDVCGFGSQQFGHILALPGGPGLARTTLSQLLGDVRVDSTLTLSASQLSGLVDSVGGVNVDIDTDVITNSGGVRIVVLPKGPGQHLSGDKALLFATYVAAGEEPTANLSRFQTVFEAFVKALPAKPSDAAKKLRSAGLDGSSANAAGSLFTALAIDDRTNQLLAEQIPTQTIDTGGGTPSYRLDASVLQSLVKSQLAKSLPGDDVSKRPTVLIENGVGTPGLVLSACDRLLSSGFAFAGSGNARSFDYPKTQVIVFPNGQDDLVRLTTVGDRVAALLRLPESDVVASTQGNNVATVVVILGRDYKP